MAEYSLSRRWGHQTRMGKILSFADKRSLDALHVQDLKLAASEMRHVERRSFEAAIVTVDDRLAQLMTRPSWMPRSRPLINAGRNRV